MSNIQATMFINIFLSFRQRLFILSLLPYTHVFSLNFCLSTCFLPPKQTPSYHHLPIHSSINHHLLNHTPPVINKMVLGWRRAFCTSIPRDPESRQKRQQDEKNKQSNSSTPISTPKIGTKFTGFFSTPSTPRLQTQTQPVSSSGLRCRTTTTTTASAPESPKLQCKTAKNSPTFFHRSNPSSPRSPSTFSLLRSTLRLSKVRFNAF